jgi:hypothetical protein
LAPAGRSLLAVTSGHEAQERRERQQHDLASTLRFDVTSNWLLKLEGHYMVGTAGLAPELNEGRPLSTLTRRWLAFLAKATMFF